MKLMKYKITDTDLDVTYLDHEDFLTMSPNSQSMLLMVFALLSDAHQIEMNFNKDIRILLKKYSPNNALLESDNYISWGKGLHDLVVDIITGKDVTSPSFKPRVKH
jgi:hypothetical protein